MHTLARKSKTPQHIPSVKSPIPSRDHAGHSPALRSILHLQRTIGNHAVQQMVQTDAGHPEVELTGPASPHFGHDVSRIPAHPPAAGALQTTLAINKPGDSHEQDADRVAQHVMRTPEPRLQPAWPHGEGGTSGVGPSGDTAQPGRDHASVQTNRVQPGHTGQGAAPPSVQEVLRSPGQPLDPATRAFMEPRFGSDFSQVRVHTGAAAEESARQVNASAYTVGHDIVFGASRFAPGSNEGRRLLAHELAHTVQQSSGAPLAIARNPKEPPFVATQQDIVNLRNTMLDFYSRLTPAARASLHRNTTVVIALVTHQNMPTLVYTVASNSTSPGIRAAADGLGLVRWDPAGIDKIGGERHAEQLTLDAASSHGFKVHAMAVTRVPCPDCGPVVQGRQIPIEWVRDPNLVLQPPGTSGTPPAGGTPPPTPPGGPPDPGKKTAKAASTRAVTAEVGTPIKPVVETTPGFRPARGAGFGGGFQIAQAMQFGNLQGAEVAKYQKRHAELQPKIEAWLNRGYSVELILIVEKPDRPDVLGKIYSEQSQLIYFHDMYINHVEAVRPPGPVKPSLGGTSSPSMKAPDERQVQISNLLHPGGRPVASQGGSVRAVDEGQIRFITPRNRDHHCEYAKETLYPEQSLSPVTPSRPPAQPEKPKPKLDEATRKALALAPTRVYILTGNINQFKTAAPIMKTIAAHPAFGEVKDYMGGGLNRSRTIVSYRSELDRSRAEALAEIVRAGGVPSVSVELSGDGSGDPGVLQVFFGRDAEK